MPAKPKVSLPAIEWFPSSWHVRPTPELEAALTPYLRREILMDTKIVVAHQRDGTTLYAVRRGPNCATKTGHWMWEPSPSERDARFLARCRFATLEEAQTVAAKAITRLVRELTR